MHYTKGDRVFRTIVHIVVFSSFVIVLLPLINLLAISLSHPTKIVSGEVFLLPAGFTAEAYRMVLTTAQFYTAIGNSVKISVLGSLLGIVVCLSSAYALSKLDLPGRRGLLIVFVFTMLFSGGIIPTYILINKMGLMNNFAAVILSGSISIYNMLVAKSYFEGLPDEIEEAAKVDGAGYLRTFLTIILPISLPMVATISLFYFVGFWNEYFSVRLFITDPTKMPLQPYLRAVLFESGYNAMEAGSRFVDSTRINYQNVSNATIFCSMLPVIIIYPFIQRYFVSGLTLGSVKG